MEADDLDNLISDSLGGVTSALEAERRAAPAAGADRNAGEAVRELQAGPPKAGDADGDEELFGSLIQSFEDEGFQRMMTAVLRGNDGESKEGPSAAAADMGAAPAGTDAGVEDFLQRFFNSFDNSVGSDPDFEKRLTSLMTSMLSNDLICEPFEKIATELEPWLQAHRPGLALADRTRYESQLRLYKKVIGIYKVHPDPLPEAQREEVQSILQDLHLLGQPPDDVMKTIQPQEIGDGEENIEDFMKTMGLDQQLAPAEQDLLKKLAEDPEELTKVMNEMADGLPEEGCKQQ